MVLFSLLIFALQEFVKYKYLIIESGVIKDEFALGNLKAEVHWSGNEFIIGLIMLAGLAVSVVLHFKRKYFQSLITVLISTFLFTISVLYFIVPKIEQYTQNAPVEFYKGLRDKDCYVETLGFKSYAHLFYSEVKCNENVKIPSQDSLLYGKINKNAYFVTKITKKSDYLNKFNIKELYEKNGFVFLIRYSNIK